VDQLLRSPQIVFGLGHGFSQNADVEGAVHLPVSGSRTGGFPGFLLPPAVKFVFVKKAPVTPLRAYKKVTDTPAPDTVNNRRCSA
jgi:hypothetical protein